MMTVRAADRNGTAEKPSWVTFFITVSIHAARWVSGCVSYIWTVYLPESSTGSHAEDSQVTAEEHWERTASVDKSPDTGLNGAVERKQKDDERPQGNIRRPGTRAFGKKVQQWINYFMDLIPRSIHFSGRFRTP